MEGILMGKIKPNVVYYLPTEDAYRNWLNDFDEYWCSADPDKPSRNDIYKASDSDIVNYILNEDYDLDYTDDWLVLTDEEADEEVFEQVIQMLWAFNSSFLAGETGLDEDVFKALQEPISEVNNDAIRNLIDSTCGIDEFVMAASDLEGRGYFLNQYDGEEKVIELKRGLNLPTKTLYAYRMC
jgi:hypothetical protein